jgi:hypothetical protein
VASLWMLAEELRTVLVSLGIRFAGIEARLALP